MDNAKQQNTRDQVAEQDQLGTSQFFYENSSHSQDQYMQDDYAMVFHSKSRGRQKGKSGIAGPGGSGDLNSSINQLKDA